MLIIKNSKVFSTILSIDLNNQQKTLDESLPNKNHLARLVKFSVKLFTYIMSVTFVKYIYISRQGEQVVGTVFWYTPMAENFPKIPPLEILRKFRHFDPGIKEKLKNLR